MHHYNGDASIFRLAYGINPNAFVDGVMNGFSLHIEPPLVLTQLNNLSLNLISLQQDPSD